MDITNNYQKILILILTVSCIHIYIGIFPIYSFVLYPLFIIKLFGSKFSFFESTYLITIIFISILTISRLDLYSISLGNAEMFVFFLIFYFISNSLNSRSFNLLKNIHLYVLLLLVLTIPLGLIFDINTVLSTQNINSDVMQSSLNNNRLIGVFGSPFEAGTVLILFAWISKDKKSQFIVLPLVIISGFLTISKAFLIGIPFIIYRYGFLSFKNSPALIVIFSIILFTVFNYVEDWFGLNNLNKLLAGIGSQDINFYTAGRFGGEFNTVQSRLSFSELIYPYGFINFNYPLDATVIYMNKVLGIYGLPILFMIFKKIYDYSKILFIYIFIISFGAPVLFKNYIAQIIILHLIKRKNGFD